MHSLRKRRTLSFCAFLSSFRSWKRSPIATAVRARSAKCANPAFGEGKSALTQALFLLPNANPIRSCATGEMAIGFDPGNRAIETFLVVFVGLGKLSRHRGELEKDDIDKPAVLDQLRAELGPRCSTTTPHSHDDIVRTFVCRVKGTVELICAHGLRAQTQRRQAHPNFLSQSLFRI